MGKFDYNQAVEELQKYRLTNERQSERVVSLGATLIRDNHTFKLGDQGSFKTTSQPKYNTN